MTANCGLCDTELQTGYLCRGDALALAQTLDRLPRVYDALGAFLAPGASPGGERVSTGHPGSVMPVDEAVLDLRYGGIALLLEGWRAALQADRGWGEPAVEGTVERRVYVAARALSMNLDWAVASWPAVGDMAQELREVERSALSIVGVLPDRGRQLGYCPTLVDGVLCGAAVRLMSGESTARCAWCGCEWPAARWLELRAAQGHFEEATT